MKRLDDKGLTLPATLGIVFALIIIGVVGWLLFGPSEEAAAPTASEPAAQEAQPEAESETEDESEGETVTIAYTNSGFSPATVTVKQGDTVVFVNQSDRDFHPASNDHPDHTIYPEFDANEEIPPGGSYNFTFNRIGSWGFHNHELEGHTGTVVVTE